MHTHGSMRKGAAPEQQIQHEAQASCVKHGLTETIQGMLSAPGTCPALNSSGVLQADRRHGQLEKK